MNLSFRIGSIFGIAVRIHLFFLILFGLFLGQILLVDGLDHAFWFASCFLLLFCFVLLHELGHSMVARAHGIRVYDIILWPLGGLARLERLPDGPRAEFQIALAGPVVNLILALLLLPLLYVKGGQLPTDLDRLSDWTLLEYALFVNLLMGGFNLVPAFPLDGGRILRALLSSRLPYLRATRVAVQVGRALMLLLALASVIFTEFISLTFIAAFVWILGGQELRQAEERERVRRAAELGLPLDWPPDPDPAGREPSAGARRFLDLSRKARR